MKKISALWIILVLAALVFSTFAGVFAKGEVNNNLSSAGASRASLREISQTSVSPQAVEILAWIPYTDTAEEYPNTIAALSTYFTDYVITESLATDPATLQGELAGKSVFLVPEPENTDSATLQALGASFSAVLTDFVNGGGTVIVLCEWDGYQGFLTASGLMDATFADGYAEGPFDVVVADHPLTVGLGATVEAADATGAYVVAGPGVQSLIVDSFGNAVVAARDVGSGHVALIGYDYFAYNDDASRIIANAVQWQPGLWGAAYNAIFDSQADLALMRQYRDELLASTAAGRMYTDLLYKASDEALAVLLDRPELMAQAKSLAAKNGNAVSAVLSGRPGVIGDTGEVVAFLDAYAKQAPPALKVLAHMVKKDMLAKQRQGQPFLGFVLK